MQTVVISLPDKRLLVVPLDDESLEEFVPWAEGAAIMICERNDPNTDTDDSKTDTEPKVVSDSVLPSRATSETLTSVHGPQTEIDTETEQVVEITEDTQASVSDVHGNISATGVATTGEGVTDPGTAEGATASSSTQVSSRDVSCQTYLRFPSTSGETSSDNSKIAIKKQYRRLPARVRNQHAG